MHKEVTNMYFNQQMFNPSTVNPNNYHAVKDQIARLDIEQNKEIANAVKAVHDLCEAVKKLDEAHQHTAFLLCLKQMGEDMHWQ